MKHFLKVASVCLLSSLLFSSCKDCDTTVSEVSEDEAKWLVYDRGDSTRFVNESGEIVRYAQTALRAEQIPGQGYNISDNCIAQLDIAAYSIIQDRAKSRPGLATNITKRLDGLEVALTVEGVGDFKIDHTQPTYATKEVNNTTFSNVFEVTRTDSAKATNLKRILFNKDYGFLSVEFYDGKKLLIAQQ